MPLNYAVISVEPTASAMAVTSIGSSASMSYDFTRFRNSKSFSYDWLKDA
jgi:hypothetical protein